MDEGPFVAVIPLKNVDIWLWFFVMYGDRSQEFSNEGD